MYDVKVDQANPLFAQMLLEQFGGATGELLALLPTGPNPSLSRM
jgi:Mn-containing catalase